MVSKVNDGISASGIFLGKWFIDRLIINNIPERALAQTLRVEMTKSAHFIAIIIYFAQLAIKHLPGFAKYVGIEEISNFVEF